LLIEGDTGKVHSKSGIRAFVGIAPDIFAADAVAMRNLQNAFYNEHKYDADAFLRPTFTIRQHCKMGISARGGLDKCRSL